MNFTQNTGSSFSINQVTLMGRTGQDRKIFNTNSGSQFITFSIATTKYKKDLVNQEIIKETQWHNIVVFNNKCLKIAEHMVKKGVMVLVVGQIQHQKYTDSSGKTRQSTEIVLKDYNSVLVVLNNNNNKTANNLETPQHTTAPYNSETNNKEVDDFNDFIIDDNDNEDSSD